MQPTKHKKSENHGEAIERAKNSKAVWCAQVVMQKILYFTH